MNDLGSLGKDFATGCAPEPLGKCTEIKGDEMSKILDVLNLGSEKSIKRICEKKEDHYLSYPIKKATKHKLRWIDAPQGEMKRLQYEILYNCIYKIKPHSSAVGFRYDHSVKTGAERHLGNKVLLTMDISNYFNSIKQNSVQRILGLCMARTLQPQLKSGSEEIDYTGDSHMLANICCFKNQLPQGAPTSPAIANLFGLTFDSQFSNIAKQENMTYTRYADDLTFSHPDVGYNIGQHIKTVENVLKHHKLKVNHKKTRILRPHRRMSVTGVVINDKLGVPKYVWRNMRAKLHNLVKGKQTITTHEYQIIRGKCEWIKSLNGARGNQLLESLSKIPLNNS